MTGNGLQVVAGRGKDGELDVSDSQGSMRNYIYIGIIVFIIMVITGLLAQVSFPALVMRAVLAALFFSVLVLGVITVGRQFFLPAEQAAENQPDVEEQPVRGTQLDIVLPGEDTVVNEPDIREQSFEPMAPQQIDPKLNNVMNEDPERIASMIKKMGLE